MATISVIIADDEPIVCAGMALLLGLQPDMEVLGEAHSAAEAIALNRSCRPDVVVMDVRMHGMNGIQATRLITQEFEETDRPTRVLIVTTYADDEAIYGALTSGASGFLLKYSASMDLAAAVRSVARGEAWIDSKVGLRVIAALAAAAPNNQQSLEELAALTPREREVLTLMAMGLDNKAIGERFVLSVATVKTHVSRILLKTGCHDRAGAVALAYRSGLMAPNR